MKKTAPEYTPVDLSRWPRKEHFEVFQSFAECTINQTVLIDITALRKHIKEVGWKFYPTIIFLLSNIMNRHPEFRMAMKDNELVIWNEVHPSYTIFHLKQRPFRHCGAISTAIFITSRTPMQIRPAMEITFLTGLRKSPGKMSFSYRLFRG
jgi:chloramphenicol O-acetyltransferase